MAEYHSFDERQIQAALDSARQSYERVDLSRVTTQFDVLSVNPHMSVSGGCISVEVSGGRVCLSLPLGIGNVCLPVPGWIPDGQAAEACLNICTSWGIPTGVRVSVRVAGITIVEQSFGRC